MTVLRITDNLVLKLKVTMYKKLYKDSNEMKMFYSEVLYYNAGHNDEVVNINLDYTYGLVLESPYADPKPSVWIDWFGVYELTNVLQKVISWFTTPDKFIYQQVNDHMELTPEAKKLKVATVINTIPLVFNPAVLVDQQTNMTIEGVTLTYTTNAVKINIPIQSIMGWYSYISRVDLAAAAQSLLSYVKPPQPGTNRISFSSRNTVAQQISRTDYKSHGVPGRQFDKKVNDELK